MLVELLEFLPKMPTLCKTNLSNLSKSIPFIFRMREMRPKEKVCPVWRLWNQPQGAYPLVECDLHCCGLTLHSIGVSIRVIYLNTYSLCDTGSCQLDFRFLCGQIQRGQDSIIQGWHMVWWEGGPLQKHPLQAFLFYFLLINHDYMMINILIPNSGFHCWILFISLTHAGNRL